MSIPAGNEISIEEVLAFNDALMAYAATGLPVELEPGDSNEGLLKKLPQINARLALRLSRGESLADSLATEPHITPRYRAALESWLRGQHPIEALDSLAATAQGRCEIEATARYSLVQPLIVLALAYVGFIYLLLTVAPKLEGIYRQLRQAPEPILSALLIAKQGLPIWGPALPVLIAAILIGWRWRRSSLMAKWLPGRTRYLDALHKAHYADSLARLLENDYSLGQALALLGPLPTESPNGQSYAAANQKLIEAETSSQRIAFDDPSVASLPALLRWAFTGDLLGQAQAEVL
ncbi:MAG: type II secretion system F family protein, partial [Aureliella sp.]